MAVSAVFRIHSIEDVERFHADLKKRLPNVSGFAQLQGLKNESDDLCRLIATPQYSERFGNRASEALRVALAGNAEIAEMATAIAKKHDWNREFKPLSTSL